MKKIEEYLPRLLISIIFLGFVPWIWSKSLFPLDIKLVLSGRLSPFDSEARIAALGIVVFLILSSLLISIDYIIQLGTRKGRIYDVWMKFRVSLIVPMSMWGIYTGWFWESVSSWFWSRYINVIFYISPGFLLSYIYFYVFSISLIILCYFNPLFIIRIESIKKMGKYTKVVFVLIIQFLFQILLVLINVWLLFISFPSDSLVLFFGILAWMTVILVYLYKYLKEEINWRC